MRRHRARILLGALGTSALIIASVWLWFRTWEPDRARFPLRGIDVSHHQGAIDWGAVADDDIAFVYLKASEGGDHHDRRFLQNWAAARNAGLATGAYHFFTFCRPGAEQADNFIARVPVTDDALPPAVDLEFGGNCGRAPTAKQMRSELDAYLARVEAAYRKPAVLYVTPEFLQAYRDALPTRALWRRAIVRTPDASAPWTVWQYHNRGRVQGITGPVDLNVFVADENAFARFKQQTAVPLATTRGGEG
ncbi:GH25 family lysozyme [Lysobacter sp. LF1]|uniref:GH25 family lysozyme n=1 Tax=Lysobacter stagni TaxID=3045172 RepID=A0ABT6XEE8_9GAMM|nr:GH25 family lysozyme [Lysobacter sp. LF1]MDI9238514.1 GH25 family lysozyme [Lysobacter sp. LF1]